jgi:hypothetical protein
MITTALVLMWMTRLVPVSPHSAEFPEVAEAITAAASTDRDPLDAAAFLTSIGYFESHYNPHAVSKADDPTKSWGPWQLSERRAMTASLGWQAFRALALIRDSQTRCGDLTQYASGHCDVAVVIGWDRARMAYRLVHGAFPGVYFERAIPSVKHATHSDRPEPESSLGEVQASVLAPRVPRYEAD